MPASLIGRWGSSTFRLSTSAVSMSLTGSCFSSESAPRPFRRRIRGRGGTIFWSALISLSKCPGSGFRNAQGKNGPLISIIFRACDAAGGQLSGAAQMGAPTLVSIQTPRGATQAFILFKVDNPVASVILFAGGHGALGLKSASSMKWGEEGFLVRSRDKFADHNFTVASSTLPLINNRA